MSDDDKCVVDSALAETLQNIAHEKVNDVLDTATERIRADLALALRGYGLDAENAPYRPFVDAIRAEIKRLLTEQIKNPPPKKTKKPSKK